MKAVLVCVITAVLLQGYTVHGQDVTVTISLVEDNVDILEGDNGTFCAVIEDPNVELEWSISVSLHTMEGTAEGGADYLSGSIVATLTNTTREVCLIIPTVADGLVEPPEMFTVFLNSPDPSVVIGRSNSTGTIRDASSVTVTVSLVEDNVDIVEGDSGTFCAVIEDPNVELERSISVTLHTMEGTAEGGADYASVFIMATLTNTMPEVCLSIPTVADGLVEPPEMFTVFLSSLSVIIGRSNSTGTIRDASNVLFLSSSGKAFEATGPWIITISTADGGMVRNDIDIELEVVLDEGGDVQPGEQMLTITLLAGTSSIQQSYTILDNSDIFPMGRRTFIVEAVILDPTLANLTVGNDPNNLQGRDSAILTILDDDVVIVEFTQNSFSGSEDSQSATVSLRLTTGSAIVLAPGLTVVLTASPGPPGPGGASVADYDPDSTSVFFAAGQGPGSLIQSFSFNVTDDNLVESLELLFVQGDVSAAPFRSRFSNGSPTDTVDVNIVDNDEPTRSSPGGGGLSPGAIVGIVVGVIVGVLCVVGVAVAAAVAWYKRQRTLSPPRETVEMEVNMSYGPVRVQSNTATQEPVYELPDPVENPQDIRVGGNVAYGHVRP